MQNLRANESKVFGVLGIVGIFVVTAAIVLMFSTRGITLQTIAAISLIPLSLLAWFGLKAQSIFVDGEDLLTPEGSQDYRRVPISSIVAARTIPLPYRLGIVTFKDAGGASLMTVVREQDLSWIMAKMPSSSITPYWNNKRG